MKKAALLMAVMPMGVRAEGQLSLSLQACVQEAVAKNISVQSARFDHEKSGYKAEEARAALLPKVSIGGSFQGYPELPITLLPGEIVGRPGTSIAAEIGTPYTASANISLNQTLFNQTALTALRLSKKMEELAALSVEKASEELAAEVAKLYFLSLTTAKQKMLVEANIIRTQRLRDIIKTGVDNGVGKQVDYERISVSLENLYTRLSNAEAMLEQQLNLMKYMLHIAPSENIILTDTAEMTLLRQTPTIPSDFSDHISIQLLEAQKEVSQINQKMVTDGYIPTLSLVGQFGYQGYRDEFRNYFRSSPENSWYSSSYLGLSLSIPVFDGLEKRSKARQAKMDYQKSALTLDDTKERLGVGYQNAMNSYQNHKNNVLRQKQNIALAEKIYGETALKYREGLATMSDVLQDEMGLNNAQDGYLTALYSFKEAEVNIMGLNGEIKMLINQ